MIATSFIKELHQAQMLAVFAPEYVQILSQIEIEMTNIRIVSGLNEDEIEAKIGKYVKMSASEYMQSVSALRNPKAEAMLYLNILEANFNYYRFHGRFAVDSQ